MDAMADMFMDLESRWETSNSEGDTAFSFHPFGEYEGIHQISPAQHQLPEENEQHCPHMDAVQDNIFPIQQVPESSLYSPLSNIGEGCEHQETLFPPLPQCQPQASLLLPEPPITPSALFLADIVIDKDFTTSPCSPDHVPSIQDYGNNTRGTKKEPTSSGIYVTPCTGSDRVHFAGDPLQVERAEQFLSALLSHPTFPLDTYGIPSPYDMDLQPESAVFPAFTERYDEHGTPMSAEEGDIIQALPLIGAESGPPRILPKISNAGVTKKMSKRAAAKVAMRKRRVRDGRLRELARTNVITDSELLCLKPKKKRRAAKFDKPKPSGFCHICSRTPKNVGVMPCANIGQGTCRKVICEKCFERFNLGNFQAVVSDAGNNWSCTHCSKTCPERAQCRTYQRTNDKLRLNRLKHEKAKGIGKRKKRNQQATIAKPKPPA